MGKKKCKPNGFTEFMSKFISDERRHGRTYPKEKFSEVASPHWKNLTQEERDRYNARAKNKPIRISHTPAKFTSQGVPLHVIEREQRERFEWQKYMETTTKNFVNEAILTSATEIQTRPMYLMMADYFYKNLEGRYSPAEIAVGKFTLSDGLQNYYHTLINPCSVETGYAFEAKDRSEKVHQLPPPPAALGEIDYGLIYRNILAVLGVRAGDEYKKGDDRRLCVFILEKDVKMIESILDQLSTDKTWRNLFDIFHFELLFHQLKNVADYDPEKPGELPITVTNYFVELEKFDWTSGISCHFHEGGDFFRHCALSYIRRWFFTIADYVAQNFGVKLVPGKHLPLDANLDGPPPDTSGWDDDNACATTSNNHQRREDSDDDRKVESYHTGYGRMEQYSSSDSDEY